MKPGRRLVKLFPSREPFASTGAHVNRASIKNFFAGIFTVAGAKHAKKFDYKQALEDRSRYTGCYKILYRLLSVIKPHNQWFSTGGPRTTRGPRSNFKVVRENALNLHFLISLINSHF